MKLTSDNQGYGLFVKSGPHSQDFALCESYQGKDKDKNPVDRERTIGYYPSLSLLIDAAVKYEMIDSVDGVEDFREMVEHIKWFTESIKDTIRGNGVDNDKPQS